MNDYPIRVLSLGAGVQSTTLLYMMLSGEIEKADHAIFADTGWEPQAVYDHLETLKPLMADAGIQFHMVRADKNSPSRRNTGNLRSDALASTFVTMPVHVLNKEGKRAMVSRQCTFAYKIEPVLLKLRAIAGLKRGERCKEIRITQLIGISYDEAQRMRDPAFSWIVNKYPLVDKRITRQDCLDWCAQREYRKPPRSACIGCPFKSNEEWRDLREVPAEWADAVDFDNQLRTINVRHINKTMFLHSSCVPLDEADLRTNQEKGIWSMFDNECEGMCGV